MELHRSHSNVQDLGSLISSPHVTVLLLWACQGSGYSPQDLQKIVLRDSALCAKIISTATKISPQNIDPSAPLSTSLDALGVSIIKSIALQSAKRIVDADLSQQQIQFLRELWFSSQVGGVIMRRLAEQTAYPDPEEAQITGLLMNIGMLTFFSQDPERYMVTSGSSMGSEEVVQREQTGYEDDHLQIADALVSSWKLESFMADAISFLYLDSEQFKGASPLIRMARLALEFCRTPLEISPEIVTVAGHLFDFTESEAETFFKAAVNQYRGLSLSAKGSEDGFGDFQAGQKRLTSVVFSIAEQDGAFPRFADAVCAEELVESARHLYLNQSPAQEAVIFTLDSRGSTLCGMHSSRQHRLVSELRIPRNARSLLSEALSVGKVRHSFTRQRGELSVFDRQLIRVCQSAGIVCVPFIVEDRPVGGVVFGVEHAHDAEFFSDPQMRMLNGSVARAFASLLSQQGAQVDPGKNPADAMSRLIHEVSNPLAIISNYLGAVGELADDGKRDEALAAVDSEVKRIGNILDYYRNFSEAGSSQNTPVDVNELTRSVIDRLQPAIFQAKDINVVTELDGSVRSFDSKPVAITQILVNLLKNASEALAQGGQVLVTTREVVTAEKEVFVEIAIHDNGPGIDREILRQLFSPVKSTKGRGHSGLGLNIVKEMVNDIGAKISCHSSAEHGTRFNLLFPAGTQN